MLHDTELSAPQTANIEVLLPDEELWRDRYMYLAGHGYMLRPRYHPEWVLSWVATGKPAYACEDSIMTLDAEIVDAMQTQKNHRVCIKAVSRKTSEMKIACLLSARELLNNPSNHFVPVLDVLPDPLDSTSALLIMPHLRPFNDPPFEVVDEIIEFIKQTLEGLCFIHDCSTMNIMMDGRPMFPEDHHPRHIHLTLDRSRNARFFSRTQRPVNHYYIDFGMSSRFEENESPYVLGAKGADQDAPESSNVHPYNAFMLDIYILGHMYQVEFLKEFLDLEFLEPLVSAMTQEQPERRPTAEAALRMLHDICRGLNTACRRWRVRKRNESGAERVVYDTISAAKVGFNLVRRGLVG